jgi:hypothetical protein
VSQESFRPRKALGRLIARVNTFGGCGACKLGAHDDCVDIEEVGFEPWEVFMSCRCPCEESEILRFEDEGVVVLGGHPSGTPAERYAEQWRREFLAGQRVDMQVGHARGVWVIGGDLADGGSVAHVFDPEGRPSWPEDEVDQCTAMRRQEQRADAAAALVDQIDQFLDVRCNDIRAGYPCIKDPAHEGPCMDSEDRYWSKSGKRLIEVEDD